MSDVLKIFSSYWSCQFACFIKMFYKSTKSVENQISYDHLSKQRLVKKKKKRFFFKPEFLDIYERCTIDAKTKNVGHQKQKRRKRSKRFFSKT